MTALPQTSADVGAEGFVHARGAGRRSTVDFDRTTSSTPRDITTPLNPADAVIGRAGRLAADHLRSPS
ncbi:hypothetical protein [Lentzea sp. NPDC060358]|uniref:hypothetical protein n=1 Tax=Lentzea sp. NPDC060358 TaxID=3347103 RepID=UPI003668AB2F